MIGYQHEDYCQCPGCGCVLEMKDAVAGEYFICEECQTAVGVVETVTFYILMKMEEADAISGEGVEAKLG